MAETSNKRDTIISGLIFLAAGMLFAYHCVYTPLTTTGVDYARYWLVGRALLNGVSPYEGDLFLDFNYPLITGGILIPFSLFERAVAERVWDVTNALFMALGILLLAIELRPKPKSSEGKPALVQFVTRHWPALVFLTAAAYHPLHRSLLSGNIDPLKFFLCALLVVSVQKRNDMAAGFVIGFLSLIKLIPIMLVIPLAVAGRWRAVFAAIGMLVLYGLFLLASGLWRIEWTLYTEVLSVVPTYWRDISGSLHRSVASIIAPGYFVEESHYKALIFVLNLVMLSLFGGWLALWKYKTSRNENVLVAFGLVMLLAFSPLLEVNHFAWVLPAFFVFLRGWVHGEIRDGWAAAIVASGAMVMAMDVFFSLHHRLKLAFPDFWIESSILLFMLVSMGGAGLTAKRLGES